MASKSTHQGHCQVCGRPQMLPGGKLSKHGYTKRWGFFSGVCSGADHLPFEQDISLIEGMIKWSTKESASLVTRAEQLEQPATEAVGVCHVYMSHRDAPQVIRWGRSEYEWVQGAIVKKDMGHGLKWAVQVDSGRFKGLEFGIGDPGFQWDAVNKCSIEITPLMVASHHNADYAKRSVRPKAEQLAKYADWQRKRIEGWVPHPEKLIPVKETVHA
jgi:hypothetical protein